jgi:hypothetical protein
VIVIVVGMVIIAVIGAISGLLISYPAPAIR